jgi:predicted ATPase/Tfp pilus assembly protein PilF
MSIFLFTDIEGSTKKWEERPDEMKQCLAKHDRILNETIAKHSGQVIKHTGDGVFAVFDEGKPLLCALKIQEQFADEDWGSFKELRIRIGLHAGLAEKRGKDYFGSVVNRTARVMSVAWGGQIVFTPEVKKTTAIPDKGSAKDLGAHLLKDLAEPQHLYQLMHPDLKLHDFPPLRSLSSRPNNLPVLTTPFLGREDELNEVIKLLRDPSCRLLTLIGPGGIGKTRLGLQSGAELIEEFNHGVFFIPLAPLTSSDYLISTIAKAVQFTFYDKEDPKIQLLNFLREKEMLLIFDNFEHLITGAGIINDILSSASKIKILVTSRELLNLKGEWILQLEGMRVPEGEQIDIEGYSAVQLFLYNARRVNASIDLSEEDKQFVVRISQLVGGLPLGIELASAWLRTLSCKEIAQEIERNMDFLVTQLRDVPERHRSLKAVFEYSWNLLNDEQKSALKYLSVFVGGFTREAASEVSGASIAILSSLVDKSLLQRNTTGRYEMLDVLRQYAAQKLDEHPDEKARMEEQHSTYYSTFLKKREKDIIDIEKPEVLKEIALEIDNIRQAWDWALINMSIEVIDDMVISMCIHYDKHGAYRDGEKATDQALNILRAEKKSDPDRIVYAKVLTQHAGFGYRLGDYDRARKLYEESLGIFEKHDKTFELAHVLNSLGNIENLLGKYGEAIMHYEESLVLYRKIGAQKGILGCLNNLGVISYNLGEFDKAKELYDESLAISEKNHYERGIGMAYANEGLVAHMLGDYEEAKILLEKSLHIDRSSGERMGVANSLHNLGLIHKSMGDYQTAKRYYQEALAIRNDIGDRMGIGISYNNLGNLADLMEETESAEEYHQKSLAVRRDIGDELGAAMSLVILGNHYLKQHALEKAGKHLNESLQIGERLHDVPTLLEVLFGFSKLFIARQKKERAFAILSYIQKHEKKDKDLLHRVDEQLSEIKNDLADERIADLADQTGQRSLETLVKEVVDWAGEK